MERKRYIIIRKQPEPERDPVSSCSEIPNFLDIAKNATTKKKPDPELIPRDMFGYCEGCTPDICADPCSEENNFNLPF